jgi:cytochrome P450
MIGWNPETFYAMLGENTRRTMTNPAIRMAQRKFLAPGFTERATANYIQEVGQRGCGCGCGCGCDVFV